MNSNEQQANREFKGVFIPVEILQNPNLKGDEKITLALIQHYTINGEKHACFLTNERIAEITGINYYKLRDRVKPKLVKLGYISTNGGIKSVSTKQQNHDTNSVDGIQQDNSKNTIQIDDSKTTIQIESIEDNSKTTIEEQRNHDTPNSKTTIQRKIKKEEKEIYILPTINKSDSHQSDPDPVNNITSNLELYVDGNTPDVPEWMNELKPVEPFEQYTDDVQGEAMQETDNNTFQADERENDPDPVTDKINNITSSWDEGIDGENDLSQADENNPDEPQENETSLKAALSDERGDGGTTTHRQAESLSNGEKTTSMGVTDPETDNVNNNFITDTQKMTVQERKEKQTELSRKWENFKEQVPQMHRADAEMYFKRFLTKVEEYYTGTHIAITQDRFRREFNALKPLADWNEQAAKKDIETWISQGFNPDTLKRYVRQKYGESHDEFVMAQWREHHSRPIEVNPEYVKNPNAPYVLPF